MPERRSIKEAVVQPALKAPTTVAPEQTPGVVEAPGLTRITSPLVGKLPLARFLFQVFQTNSRPQISDFQFPARPRFSGFLSRCQGTHFSRLMPYRTRVS